ncbi:rhodanese-like domain-containing protein [Ectothiorhodospiraceae bacterium 2226]|nr:rhodanese-like domain-containing protein [Ectothiorhodospiraceae bacterium 2226]
MKLNVLRAAGVLLMCAFISAAHAADDGVVDAMEEYMMFVDYSGSTIRPEQIPAADWKNIYVIDARDADQYASEHIPGAVNIEWRQVLDHRDELPRDRSVLIYCNSGTLSAQAGFALRLAGHENVRILQGGLDEWKRLGGFEAYERAVAEEAR